MYLAIASQAKIITPEDFTLALDVLGFLNEMEESF
jgi:hypothetical protein